VGRAAPALAMRGPPRSVASPSPRRPTCTPPRTLPQLDHAAKVTAQLNHTNRITTRLNHTAKITTRLNHAAKITTQLNHATKITTRLHDTKTPTTQSDHVTEITRLDILFMIKHEASESGFSGFRCRSPPRSFARSSPRSPTCFWGSGVGFGVQG